MVVLPIDGMNTVEWSRRGEPFPHTIARDVFSKEFYGGMDRQFQAILDRGLSEMPAYGQLMRMSEYDAYGISFDQTLTGYLSIFISQAWHNLLTSLFHVNGTGHVYVGAHHHKCGSTGGKIHTDLNSAWFPVNDAGGVRFPDHQRCAYKSGAGSLPIAEKVQVYRAVAMIFYLHNDGWEEGVGGETGLFVSKSGPADAPCARVAPENNSVLVFECTPRSYHAFLRNPGAPRNSIIMWAHRTRADALVRWRESEVEKWRA